MNYAIPDAPAFKALNIQPSEIMRPSTTQELALILSNQALGSSLPSAFALECSPYLMIGGESLTLKQYQESVLDRVLYHTRISVASQRGGITGDTTRLSFGIRFTLLDESDLRLDKHYINQIYSFNDSLLAMESRIRDYFRRPGPVYYGLSDVQKDSINTLVSDSTRIATKALEDSISVERENAIKRNWNKPIVEVGLAVAGYSADSVHTSGIIGDKAALWLVAAGNIQEWGQWVIGANGSLRRNNQGDMSVLDGSLGARMYAGSNTVKGFMELSWQAKESFLPMYLYQIGTELRVYSVFWVNLSAGVESVNGGGTKFTSTIDVRIGTP
jgi:hypothetical protein